MMMILLATSLGVIQCLPIFTSCQPSDNRDHMHEIGHFVRSVYVALNSVMFLVFLFKMRKWKTKRWIKTIMNQLQEEDQSDLELVSINRVQHCNITKPWYQKLKETRKLAIFAILTLCYAICDLCLFLSSKPDQPLQDILTAITAYLCYMFYLTVVTLFDICYNDVILKSCSFFYNALTFMIGGLLCFWFSITFNPGYELAKRCHKEGLLTANQSNQTISRTLHFVVSDMHSFFEPFAIEFFMFTIGLLIKLWNTMYEKDKITETEGIGAAVTLQLEIKDLIATQEKEMEQLKVTQQRELEQQTVTQQIELWQSTVTQQIEQEQSTVTQ